MGRNKYALIVETPTLPDPMLVECGPYSLFTMNDLQEEYRNKIYTLPNVFNGLYKDILHKSSLAKVKERLKKLLLYMVLTGCWRRLQKRDIENLLIYRLIDYKIWVSLDWKATRSATKLFRLIRTKLHTIRNNRHKEELHLPIGFPDEVTRSLNELKYVSKLYKL